MTSRTKILIVEHDPSDIELLQYELSNGGLSYVTEIVENEQDYCFALKNFVPDIILSDYRLPRFDGPSAFNLKRELTPDTPFIFVSGTIGEENSIEQIKNGVTDYALKDALFTLPSKVKRALKEATDKQHKDKIYRELLQSEKRLVRAQELAHMGSWEMDFETNVLIFSDEACRIVGLSPCDHMFSLEAWFNFIHPEDLAFVKRSLQDSRESFKEISFAYRLLLKHNVVKHIWAESKFEYDINQKPISLYGIMQDITPTTLAEMERAQMVNDLIQRNRDLEQFAYIVSHNLRGPLANILGAAKGLNYSGLSSQNKDVLSHGLMESVTKLDDVLKDLNNILQVNREISETKQMVVFSVLVEDIKLSMKDLMSNGDIEINYDFSEIDEMLTLKSYLHSIFYHLIFNSIKFRQRHIPGVINIVSRSKSKKIELMFSDNGMGIDLEKRIGQVFGLYKRFHDNIEGKGLGLFMIKTQVETLGGAITITSAVNKGTTFKIEFEK